MVTQNDLIGQLEGFPIEVVEKMLERQVEQGNIKNINLFQINKMASRVIGAFDWYLTFEGDDFWNCVIYSKNFDLFFTKYPNKIEEYPKVMMVWNINKLDAIPRVVQFFIKNSYYAWNMATNEEDAEVVKNLTPWNHAEDPLTFNKNN